MPITVPQAGNVAGRAAQIRVEAPETGAIIAEFGSRMAGHFERVKSERDAIQQQRAQLGMARDMAMARQEVEQTSDPVELGTTWQQRSAEIRAKYLDQIQDPAMKERLGLAFEEIDGRHKLAVGNRAIALTKSQREADWIDHRAAITAEAGRADPESFDLFLELGEQEIETRLATGDIDPAQAARERQALRVDLYGARARQAIADDPEAFLAQADAGGFDALGDGLADIRLTAERELARRNDAAAKEADQQLAAQKRAVRARLSDQAQLFDKGLSASDEAMLTDPNILAIVNSDPDLQQAHAQALAAKALRDEIPNIKQKTPAELRAEIAREKATPKDRPDQAARLAVLESWLDKAETEWASDGVKAARSAGWNLAPLPDIDSADPSALAGALTDRLNFDAWQREKGFNAPQAVLSSDEQTRLKAVMAPTADVAPKLALAEAMAATGPDARRVAGIVGKDPVFKRALSILQTTGDRDLAAELLAGQQKEALGTVSLPPKTQRQLTFAAITGGAYSSDAATEAEIFEAASALYAADAAGVNPDGADSPIPFKDDTEAQDRFARAIARVSGATADAAGELTVGGLQKVNGAKVILPRGVSREATEDAWEAIDVQLRGGVWDDRYQSWSFAGEAQDPLRALRGASIDPGAAPALGPDAAARWSGAQLRRVGESDVYELVINRNGREMTVPIGGDANGRAFRFRLPKLIEGSQR